MMKAEGPRSPRVRRYLFEVSNVRAGVVYRFAVTNFVKGDSLYRHGMKPLAYSRSRAAREGTGWRRVGERIRYYKNPKARRERRRKKRR